MSNVRTLILRAPGTNCDAETEFAFQQAGAEVSLVHVNRLIRREERLMDYRIMVIPGGFTYGDDISGGKILANELGLKLGEDIARFIEDGRLILGICNGLQVLVKAGFLPELSRDGSPLLTLAANDSGKFECRWVYLGVHKQSPCIFTRGMDSLYLPVAHAEGKLVVLTGALTEANVALFYTDEHGDISAGYPYNPNGSMADIAGTCDGSGRIFALMPHPERHIHHSQHPRWYTDGNGNEGDGFKIFKNAVVWIKGL